MQKRVACILLASGYGKRFGENKLLKNFCGKPLFEYTVNSLPLSLFCEVVVVTQYPEIIKIAQTYGLKTVRNSMVDPEISATIQLGLKSIDSEPTDGCMFCVCDQPLRERSSIINMLNLFEETPHKIIALSYAQKKGNPVIFPSSLYIELAKLSGKQSGSAIIEKHGDLLTLCPAHNKWELLDIDTLDDFQKLEAKETTKP